MYEQKRGEPSTLIGQFMKEEGHYSDFWSYRASTPRGKTGKTMMKEFLKEEELWEDFIEWVSIEKL